MGGDVRPDDAAVMPIALLTHEFLRLEPGEQACDVGLRSDHHAAHSGASQAAWLSAAEDAKDVVLGIGKAERFETLLEGTVQEVSGAHEGEERLLLGTREAGSLLDSRGGGHSVLLRELG